MEEYRKGDITLEKLYASQCKMGVLIERLDAKFDLLLEGFGALNKRVGELELRMERIEERMDALEGRMSGLEARVSALEDCVSRLEKRIEMAESKLEAIFDVLGTMVTRDEFAALERRVPGAA